jgi:hypothetical protein
MGAPSLLASFEADFGQCAVDEFAKAHQATAEDRSSAAVDGDGATLQRVERENRGVQAVSEVVSGVAQTFDLFGDRDSAVTRACSVTASAIAVSRHRLRVWNCSTEMGALCSTASPVIVWQISP